MRRSIVLCRAKTYHTVSVKLVWSPPKMETWPWTGRGRGGGGQEVGVGGGQWREREQEKEEEEEGGSRSKMTRNGMRRRKGWREGGGEKVWALGGGTRGRAGGEGVVKQWPRTVIL